MRAETARLTRLIDALRVSFNRLKGVADDLHRDLKINAAMRGVLQSLAEGGAKTVPAIAREKGVSRQHIQITVDTLVEGGLVEARDNVAHRRSPLISLTERGGEVFGEARRREAALLKDLARGIDPAAFDAAAALLEALNQRLVLREGKRDDDA